MFTLRLKFVLQAVQVVWSVIHSVHGRVQGSQTPETLVNPLLQTQLSPKKVLFSGHMQELSGCYVVPVWHVRQSLLGYVPVIQVAHVSKQIGVSNVKSGIL